MATWPSSTQQKKRSLLCSSSSVDQRYAVRGAHVEEIRVGFFAFARLRGLTVVRATRGEECSSLLTDSTLL